MTKLALERIEGVTVLYLFTEYLSLILLIKILSFLFFLCVHVGHRIWAMPVCSFLLSSHGRRQARGFWSFIQKTLNLVFNIEKEDVLCTFFCT